MPLINHTGWNAISLVAQIDRGRNGGVGRDVHASRLAGGLSAIGALSLGIGGEGLPKHLEAVKVSHVRQVRKHGVHELNLGLHIQFFCGDFPMGGT